MERFSEVIKEHLENEEISIVELADKLDINYNTLVTKMRRDSFTYEEFLKISGVLNIDLNKLKETAFLHTGTLQILKENKDTDNEAYYTRIDEVFYEDRAIDLHDKEEAFLDAIEIGVSQLFEYIGKGSVDITDETLGAIIKSEPVTISVNGEKYNIFLVIDGREYNLYMAFNKEDIIDNKRLLKNGAVLKIGEIVVKTSRYLVKYWGKSKTEQGRNEYELSLRDGKVFFVNNQTSPTRRICCKESELFKYIQDILEVFQIDI
jgi:hypothetical protein